MLQRGNWTIGRKKFGAEFEIVEMTIIYNMKISNLFKKYYYVIIVKSDLFGILCKTDNDKKLGDIIKLKNEALKNGRNIFSNALLKT